MCGISAYIGLVPGFDISMDGIRMLQNRGYDSTGICSITSTDNGKNNKLTVHKFASKLDVSPIKLLEDNRKEHENNNIMIGHTRWATHGPKTDENSHPHLDFSETFALVHNGIIENYAELKKELIEECGISFLSQTDTEVVVNLISAYYNGMITIEGVNIKELSIDDRVEFAVNKAISRLEGTWGLVIICTDTPNRMYCSRHGSPLLIGLADKYTIVASEQSAFCSYVNNYICLNDNDIVILEKKDEAVSFTKLHEYETRQVISGVTSTSPAPFPHWTIKEIHEQHDSALRAIGMGGRIGNDNSVILGGLDSHAADLVKIDNLIFLGCGTSYNAGMHVLDLFKRLSGFNTVQIFDGAEFTKYDVPKLGKTGIVLLSQSGETKDLHRCITIAKEEDLFMIGVVNVVDSQIARDVHCGVYLNAGKEVGVASTKAFTSQIIVLTLIAVWFAQKRSINENARYRIMEDVKRLSLDIKLTIRSTYDSAHEVASYLTDKHSVFILGKNRCEAVANEGALKIKEIGYINACGYSSSALRHGPFALLEPGTPVILVAPNDEFFGKNKNVLEEVRSREAFTICISDCDINGLGVDIKIRTVYNESFRGLLSTIPMQLIAYELALRKGHNPDFPRNLAKTITVE
jgi:glucosamine--fructose-6-phosphate aminotransferase (isomerizing)